ncbi:uridine diphosphate glucose pyrophosphatase NUDT14-like isoform X2 [Ischnura elegans]|uniref:uridine diphosphate glucose pyrophosphatase NUDT14-like isoform X2 n=1 Tax=Ischnura elegans TaxID=197161 RepID=UPI001ED88684|nr:uridine diphosphate glucose pyrophosphatase NUDT14-like isoform X2 [Ischnura elegans]
MVVCFQRHGVRKKWDLLKIHDSVAILIYNITRKVVVLVKQFRPAVFYGAIPACDSKGNIDISKYDPKTGLTLELCAGIVDKNKSLEEIAQDEVLEECGYRVPVTNLQRVIQYRSSVGISGDKQTVFYVEVTDDMRVSQGGGNIEEGEFIEVVEMTIPDVKKLLDGPEVLSPGGFLFALTWFLHNKGPFE